MTQSWIAVIAVLSLAVLESIALYKGLNGTMFSLIVAAIAGIAGYEVRALSERGKVVPK